MRLLYSIIHLLKRFAFILLIAVSFQATAQNTFSDTKVDSLLQVLRLPDLDSLILIAEQGPLEKFWYVIKKNRGEIENTTLHKLFQKIEKLAADNKNPGLEMYAGIWQYYIEAKIPNSNYNFRKKLEKIVEKATKSRVLWVEIIAKYYYASWLIKRSEDVESIEKGIWIFRWNIEKIIEKNDVKIESTTLAEHYRVLTGFYYAMDDLPNAILYSIKALNMDYPRGSKLISTKDRMYKGINNNLGVYYRELNQLDSSTFYFKRVFDLPLTKNSSLGDSVMHAVSGGNLGENLYLKGNYQDALPLLQKDADMNTKIKYWGNASNALILIADIYLTEGDLKKAKHTLDKAAFAAHASKKIKRLSKLYPILSKYYRTIGEPTIALIYADSTIIAMDSLKRRNDLFRGTRVEEAYNKDKIKREAEKELIIKNDTIKQKDNDLFYLLLLIFIGVLGGFFIFRKFKLRAKQQKSKLVNKVAQVTDKLSVKESELDNKIQEINAKKNAVNWREFKINSDEQWEHFLVLFQKEHPNFIKNIKSKFPKVTSGEIRLLCTSRLGLDDNAIGSILGVNVNSISQTRRRFMRKSKIENLSKLKELIFSV